MTKPVKRQRQNREQQKAARVNELLDSAWTLFCQKGYESLSIDEVAEFAGYSRMPIYSLFGDKQNLFFEVWRKRTSDILPTFLAGCSEDKTIEENLFQLAKNIVSARNMEAQGYGEFLFFVVQTVSLNRPDIRTKLQSLTAEHIAAFAAMVQNSKFPRGSTLRTDPTIIAKHLLAHINGMSAVVFVTGDHFETEDDLIAQFLALALNSSI